jgi:hypothetical protein
MLGQNAIHGSDRAELDVLVEQVGVDFRSSQIDEPRLPQQVVIASDFPAIPRTVDANEAPWRMNCIRKFGDPWPSGLCIVEHNRPLGRNCLIAL